MPTYQYACTDCDNQLEAVQKFSDDPLTVCPSCEGRLRKVFSPAAIVFKGSGFYRTDSRSGSSSAVSSSKDAGAKANGSTSDGGASGSSGTASDGGKAASSGSGSGDGAKQPASATAAKSGEKAA